MAVVDNSSALRLEDDVPLVVPEVNADAIGGDRLIANPNCTTAILVVALEPLRQAFGLKRVIVSTYQAASGAGARGHGRAGAGDPPGAGRGRPGRATRSSPIPLPFNVIPQIDSFQPNGYTPGGDEGRLGKPEDHGDCPTCWCPAPRSASRPSGCMAEAVTIETERPVDAGSRRAPCRPGRPA